MIERCENSPTVVMLERIAKALQADPSTLLARKDWTVWMGPVAIALR